MGSRPRCIVCGVRIALVTGVAIVTAIAVVRAVSGPDRPEGPAARSVPEVAVPPASGGERRAVPPSLRRRADSEAEPIQWRRSVAVGSHAAGRLVRAVQLPAERPGFFTWDPILRRSPNRHWRRWGTDRLVRILLEVARAHRRAHPRAPRMAIGDLSRPRGGDFGPQYGRIGHASHQNGLDVDVYYPRADGRERAPRYASQIDRRLAQELVDRFLAKGAIVVFVGPGTGLTGPPERVQPLAHHDTHMHVRLAGT